MQRRPARTHLPSNRGFPSQLFAMLEQVERDGMAHIVSWQPHGRAFKVHRKGQFVQTILPLWFRHSNYNSFQRQLNIYGFRRFTEGRDKDAYYHEHFVRGEYEQTLQIERNAVKGTTVRRPSDHTSFPDFYLVQRNQTNDAPATTTAQRATSTVSRSESLNERILANIPLLQQGIPSTFAHPNDFSATRHPSTAMVPNAIRSPNIFPANNLALETALFAASRHNNYIHQQNLIHQNNNSLNTLLLELSSLPNVSFPRAGIPTLGPTGGDELPFQTGGGRMNSIRPATLNDVLRAQALLLTQQQQQQPAGHMLPLTGAGMSIPPHNTQVSPEVLELIRERLRDLHGPGV